MSQLSVKSLQNTLSVHLNELTAQIGKKSSFFFQDVNCKIKSISWTHKNETSVYTLVFRFSAEKRIQILCRQKL